MMAYILEAILKKLFVALIAVASMVSPALADDMYRVKVTRVSEDLYQVDGKQIFIQTQYCYKYGYSVDAILQVNSNAYTGYGAIGKIIFTNPTSECNVVRILS